MDYNNIKVAYNNIDKEKLANFFPKETSNFVKVSLKLKLAELKRRG